MKDSSSFAWITIGECIALTRIVKRKRQSVVCAMG